MLPRVRNGVLNCLAAAFFTVLYLFRSLVFYTSRNDFYCCIKPHIGAIFRSIWVHYADEFRAGTKFYIICIHCDEEFSGKTTATRLAIHAAYECACASHTEKLDAVACLPGNRRRPVASASTSLILFTFPPTGCMVTGYSVVTRS